MYNSNIVDLYLRGAHIKPEIGKVVRCLVENYKIHNCFAKIIQVKEDSTGIFIVVSFINGMPGFKAILNPKEYEVVGSYHIEWTPSKGNKVRIKKRFDSQQSVGIIVAVDKDYYNGTSCTVEFTDGPFTGEVATYKDICLEPVYEENEHPWDQENRWKNLEI